MSLTRIVSAILMPILMFSLLVTPFPAKAEAAAGVQLTFDLGARGQTITNKFNQLNMWDKDAYWTSMADNQETDYFATKYPFVKTMKLMQATGGCYVGFDRCTTNRDLFIDPSDRSNLTDYKFDTLIHATRNIVNQGLTPYIVTGNVPIKYSSNPVLGVFELNVSPPDDYNVYYDYMLAMADALVDEFGVNEMKSWKWGVLTEFENGDMFKAGSVNAQQTKEAYLKLYDYTVDALQEAIGEDNLIVGAHAMAVSAGLWSHLEFIDHVAKGVNKKTGEIGTQLNFITGSYYDEQPGEPNPSYKSLKDTLNSLRARAVENGLMNLEIGIDEGRILAGMDGVALAPRAVGHSFQAAADARLFRQLHDWNIDFFSLWSLTTDGIWSGVDSVSTNIFNLSYRMVGDQQITPQVAGSPNDPGNEIGGIGGYNEAENKLHLMVYNYNADIEATMEETPTLVVENIAPVEGNTVTIKQWYVDDDNANFWPTWWEDQAAQGIYENSIPYWSRYSAEVMFTLYNQADKDYWYSREEAYKKLAELKSTTGTAVINNGKLILEPSLGHHGVVFYEITNADPTSAPKVAIDDLDDWSKADTYSDTLMIDRSNAALLGDPSRVMRKGASYDASEKDYITYYYPGIVSLGLTALYATTAESIGDFKFYTSADGLSWEKQYGWTTEDSLINEDLWTKREYNLPSVPAGTNYFKLEFPVEEAFFYNPQLSSVKIVYAGECGCSDPLTYSDELNDWSIAFSNSNGLQFDTGNSELVSDSSRVIRSDVSGTLPESIVYHFQDKGITGATASALFSEEIEAIRDFKFYTSKDGSLWSEHTRTGLIDTHLEALPWTNRQYRLTDIAAGTTYLKIEFPLGGINYWLPQLSRVSIQTTPSAPANVTATATGMTEVQLGWSASAGAVSYNVYRALSAEGAYEKINPSPITATAYVDSGLTAGSTYYYKISAVGNTGESGASDVVSATTPLTRTVVYKDELDDWSIAHSHSPGLSFDTQNGAYVDDNSRVMRADTTSVESIVYQFDGMLRADVNGLFSHTQEEINDFKFYLSQDGTNWTPYIGATIHDTPITTIVWTNRKYTLDNIPQGTAYLKIEFPQGGLYFWNPQLSRVEIHAPENEEPEEPEAPTGLAASSSGTSSIELGWTAVTGASSYHIYRASASGGPFTKVNTEPVTATSYIDTGLTAGTTYYYQVTAVQGGVESTHSATASAATASLPPNPPLDQPIGSGPQKDTTSNEPKIIVSDGKLQVDAAASNSGMVSLDLPDGQIKQAIKTTMEGILTIEVITGKKRQTKDIALSIPLQSLSGSSGTIHTIRVRTGSATMEIKVDPSAGIVGADSSKLSLHISLVDPSSLTKEARQRIGSQTVYDFSLSVDDREVNRFDYPGAIVLSLAYTLGDGEHPDQIVSYFIREDGALEVVQNSKYKAATGEVTFQPAHFSLYAAAHVDVSFIDLHQAAWAESVIRSLAAREIVNGKGDGSFQPNQSVTRAEFLQMLMKGLNLVDVTASSQFSDLKEGMWYYQAVASAEALGITQGRGNGTFDATATITREEMAVIAYRAVRMTQLLKLSATDNSKPFTDGTQISAYAEQAVSSMQQAGIINGFEDGSYRPKATATRAESASILYKLLF
ncbi:hypothetical protein B1748_12155 [Paenibacillus sp. MY03]|uniref:S-layer homology domain-containing protein n=1 Tax=Paenibacillus sp. MY03 TaxID=302980 RepID=UPI000B3C0310|nr:S-layer homology domain-containing protein [Paenibacillus sp. MY03]OUS76429.1 hypothetical protein B1748_12155 [Paenibacillus sp. MY03]